MNNPFNNAWAKWNLSNLKDERYYRMGTWAEPQQPKPGFFKRMIETIRKDIVDLLCRLESFNNKLSIPAVEQQCGCAEA